MNRDSVVAYYESFDENNRAIESPTEEVEFIYTKRLLDKFIDPGASVVELGCGTGYYGLYLADKCAAYHGVDLAPNHVEQFRTKIEEQGLSNVTASVGDATNLNDIVNDSFDVVLVFGPMYHLSSGERAKVLVESRRVAKMGGIVLVAYINKIGAILGASLDDATSSVYPNEESNRAVLHEGNDDVFPGVFYFSTPEEIVVEARAAGLHVVTNVGIDFVLNRTGFNNASLEKREAWYQLMDYMAAHESCSGVSSHAILVCQK